MFKRLGMITNERTIFVLLVRAFLSYDEGLQCSSFDEQCTQIVVFLYSLEEAHTPLFYFKTYTEINSILTRLCSRCYPPKNTDQPDH